MKPKLLKKKLLYVTSLFMVSLLLMTTACAQKKQDLLLMLSDRHQVPAAQDLEKHYTSIEDLISDLLELRLVDNPPFVALRAEELLIEYSDREDVVDVLEEDLEHPERKGLARIIIRRLDRVRDEDAKIRLSKKSAQLIRSNTFFTPLKEYMTKSSDPVVKSAILD